MTQTRKLNVFALALVVLASAAVVARNLPARAPVSLLNVSYDPTRELYARLNSQFVSSYANSTRTEVQVRQAHGGSSRQARSVISGDLEADVVSLALPSDVGSLQKRGLVGPGWAARLPNDSRPYYSTIVFVVRAGNPRQIRDWPDLLQAGVEIITPDPRTSGNGKLSALAAWGAVLKRGGSEADARAYLKAFYEHTPFLESGARGAATAFAVEKLGDVHLSWENEALRETDEAKGALEIVYPPLSILAEPVVAWVDANVARHHTEAPARAYLEFLFSEAAQEVIAESGYRPFDASVFARHAARFPRLTLFSVQDIAKDWDDAQQKFFADDGIIETVSRPSPADGKAREQEEESGSHDVVVPSGTSGFTLKNWLAGYSAGKARSDLQAGLTVAAISLPQSIAYALIAGVDPRFGLFTAIVFTAVASIFGSSSHLINGPTGAVSLVVFSTLSFFDPEARLDAYEGMFVLAAMIGVIQILISVCKLGDLTRYISESVITGFMAGAATLTIVGQIGNALGLKSQGTGHQHVFYRLWLTLTQNAPLNFRAVAISAGAIAIAISARQLVRRYKLPQLDMFVALLLVATTAYLFGWSQPGAGGKPAVSLIEEVPAALPGFHIPVVQWEWVARLTPGAFAIGVLGLLETLAIAKAISYKTGQPLDFNRQCLAEGLGNLTGGFFRCMPGAGSLSRSAINHQSGAATKMSGVFTAAIVALLVLVFAPLTRFIPKAALAGLLIVAAARLIELHRIRYIVRATGYDALLMGLTAVATLAVGVEFSIFLGVLVSALLFIPRAAKLKIRELVVTDERLVRERVASDPPARSVAIYDLEGELFFGAAPELERQLQGAFDSSRTRGIRHVVLRVKRVRDPDAVCFERLERALRAAQTSGLTVLLAGIRPDLLRGMERLHWSEWLLRDHWFPEQETEFSATLNAVRRGYELAGEQRQGEAIVYYLV